MVKSLKYLFLTLCTALSLGSSPAFSAGTLPLAMAQQIDINGQPLAGCQVTFFVAGTVATLQNNYADFGLTTAQSNPLQCDQSGRIPMFWLADGLIHVRMTDSAGTPVIDTTMQVLGPSSGGGGGGGTVDPTSVMSTGDVKGKYATGPLAGFVRLNALTIGNAGSGATERANADTQALFIFLYGVDPNLVVSGGRTGNALNDYNAGKTIAVPDMRGRAPGAFDAMGNSAAGRLSFPTFGGATCCDTVGSAGGSQFSTIIASNLPPHSHNGSGTTAGENVTHTHNGSGSGNTGGQSANHSHTFAVPGTLSGVTANVVAGGAAFPGNTFNGTTSQASGDHTHPFSFSFTSTGESNPHTHTYSFTTDNGPGSGQAFATTSPLLLMTFYMKL